MKPYVPERLSDEFLLVDVMNNLEQLAEEQEAVLRRVQHKAHMLNKNKLLQLAKDFGTVRTKKFFVEILSAPLMSYA